VVQESRKDVREGGASVVRGSGVKDDDPKLSGSPPKTVLEASKRIPLKECRIPAAVSEDPKVPEILTEMLQKASVLEEHRALMVTVVEKILSAKSGLNEACASLLRGFEVRDVMLSFE
jgi:hypothetical protein